MERARRSAAHAASVLRALTVTAVFALTPAAFVSAGLAAQGDAWSFTLVQINDTYRIGDVEEGTLGGLGRVVTELRRLNLEGRDPVVLHAGDFLYPSLESQIWNGAQMVAALNFVHSVAPVIAVPGNHEFDGDASEFVAVAKDARFRWLGGNLTLKTGDAAIDRMLESPIMIERAGRKVGIFGLTLHGQHGGPTADYVTIDSMYVALAEALIASLEGDGADLIIGLTHLDLDIDQGVAALKSRHPKLVWVAGGHEHFEQRVPAAAGAALITKAASNARTLWEVTLRFDADGAPVVSERSTRLTESIALDADYQKAVYEGYHAELLRRYPDMEQAIGHTTEILDGTEESIRASETAFGDFVVDQMKNAFDGVPVDFAIINSGTLRLDDRIVGAITHEHIMRTFFYPTRVRYIQLEGRHLRSVLERSVGANKEGDGAFLQVSGLRFCYDGRRPSGDRVLSVQHPDASGAWVELQDRRVYTLAAPDFIYGGGDGYDFARRAITATPAGPDLEYLVLDAVYEATARGEAIRSGFDVTSPRIKRVRVDGDRCF